MPFPPKDGESIVIMNDIRMLKSLGHTVSLFCLNTNKRLKPLKNTAIGNEWDYFYSADIRPNSIVNLMQAILSPMPLQIARFYDTIIEKKIQHVLQTSKIDLILYQGLAMTQYLSHTPAVNKAYRIHNIEHNLWTRLAEKATNPLKKLFYSTLAKSLKTYEMRGLRNITSFFGLSEDESAFFKKHYSESNTTAIPISLASNFQPAYSLKNHGLLFIGSLDWKPNIEGLNWFLKEIYPAIDHIQLTIAGKGHFSSNHPNVKVVTNYDSTEDLLASHRLMIVPLLSGAGIRIKILEAMHYGIPCISTRIGAEGIIHNNCIRLLDKPQDWINEILKIYENEEVLSETSNKMKLNFNQMYSNERICLKWQESLSMTYKKTRFK